jgi:hypothetical protein
MTAHPLIASDLAAVLRTTDQTLHMAIRLGRFPKPDCRLPANGSPRAWTLETIENFSPEIAKRLELPIVALAGLPPIKL